MSTSRTFILETDGASRGNPGLAGAGIIIRDEHGHRLEATHEFLGTATNNQAEYKALIAGLKAVTALSPESVTVRMDSELVVKQMNGQYRVKSLDLLPLYVQAVELASALPRVNFVHVRREQNPEADRLANIAIDSRMIRGRGAAYD